MATLYLIRHGQAGFGQAEYDVLSTLGAVQAQALGRYLVMAQRPIDLLFSAPRKRHRATCDSLCLGMQAAGDDSPPWAGSVATAAGDDAVHASAAEAGIVTAFDEFPFGEILATACGPGGLFSAEYSALLDELAGGNPLHDGRTFGRLFRLAMPGWASGQVAVSESFPAFCTRIENALGAVAEKTAELPSGHAAAVVTSAGAISAALRYVLELSGDTMLRLCLALYNTGVTELRVRRLAEPTADGKRVELSLISLNGVPHLLDPAQRTFR